MAVRLRLKRMGSKKRPFLRIVAIDGRNQRDGRFLETLGYYNPKENPYRLQVEKEKIFDWLNKGATMSGTVETLLRKEGIVQEYNVAKQHGKSVTATEGETPETAGNPEKGKEETGE